MPKHMIEEDFIGKNGFKAIRVGSHVINVDNVDNAILDIEGDGTVDLDIKNNKLYITTRMPIFSKIEW